MEELKKYQKIIVSILKNVIDVCEENNIQYFLIDGSCLGAIRHKGIIPWDDDIDMAIFSSDYDLFFSQLRKSLDIRYEVEGSFDQRKYPNNTDAQGRVYDTEHLVRLKSYNTDRMNITSSYVDVMLICGCPQNAILEKFHYMHVLLLKSLLKLSNRESIGFNSDKRRGLLEKSILLIAQKFDFSKIINEYKVSDALKRCLLKYDPKKSAKVFSYPSDYRSKEIVPFEYYGNGRKVEFDGMTVIIPSKAEKYLSRIYGDYMIVPPVNQRHTHIKNIIK